MGKLWEIACGKQVGFNNLPIVCVNVDGYYNDFQNMLKRAHSDGLLYMDPDDIVHFENTSELAIHWIEKKCVDAKKDGNPSKHKLVKERNTKSEGGKQSENRCDASLSKPVASSVVNVTVLGTGVLIGMVISTIANKLTKSR